MGAIKIDKIYGVDVKVNPLIATDKIYIADSEDFDKLKAAPMPTDFVPNPTIYFDNGTIVPEILFVEIMSIPLTAYKSYFIEGYIRVLNQTSGTNALRLKIVSLNTISANKYTHIRNKIAGNGAAIVDSVANFDTSAFEPNIEVDKYGGQMFTCQISGDDLPIGDTLSVQVSTYPGTPTGQFITKAAFVKVRQLN